MMLTHNPQQSLTHRQLHISIPNSCKIPSGLSSYLFRQDAVVYNSPPQPCVLGVRFKSGVIQEVKGKACHFLCVLGRGRKELRVHSALVPLMIAWVHTCGSSQSFLCNSYFGNWLFRETEKETEEEIPVPSPFIQWISLQIRQGTIPTWVCVLFSWQAPETPCSSVSWLTGSTVVPRFF